MLSSAKSTLQIKLFYTLGTNKKTFRLSEKPLSYGGPNRKNLAPTAGRTGAMERYLSSTLEPTQSKLCALTVDHRIIIGMDNVQLILDSMPLSIDIKGRLKAHPEILTALKLLYPEKYVRFGAISLPPSVLYPNDELIGIILYDIKDKNLDQDYLVVQGDNTGIVLYSGLDTASKKISSPSVKHINEFMKKYGANGDFADTHHPKLSSLHPDIQSRITDTCNVNGYAIPD